MYDLLIEDATIVSGRGRQVADIAIKKGRIVYVGARPAGRARTRINAIGKFVMPGVIDTHVHFRDPGHAQKETWETGSRAAASSGVTTVLDMPNTKPPTIKRKALRSKRKRAAANSRVNFGLWAGATADNIDDLNAMVDDGACGIKIFMGNSTGTLMVPPEALQRIFEETRGLIGVHAEDEEELRRAASEYQDIENPQHHLMRPESAAVAAVRRLIELVRATERHVHVCHLSTAEEVHLLDPIGGRLPITVEVCPHHLFLSVESHGELGNRVKCNPPVRPELDRRSLWTAVKRGRIDTIGSDHAPHTLEEKKSSYWEAPSGIPGVETTFPLIMGAVQHGKLSLERMVDLLSERPAQIFGLKKKGRIEAGADADLVLFTEGQAHRLTNADLLCQVGWSPYVGREVAPKPDLVLVGGNIIARSGVIVDDEVRGTEVRPT